MVNIKSLLFDHLLNDMITPVVSCEDSGVVLVLCGITSGIVSSCCRMYNLMDSGILAVESLALNREMLDMSVLYFIEPSIINIDLMIQDFSVKHKYKYGGRVHCYFTDTVSDELLNKISSCNALTKRITTFQELNIQWIANESRVYTLTDTHNYNIINSILPTNKHKQDDMQQLSIIAKQLTSLCFTLHQLPSVRIYGDSDVCRRLGSMVENELQQMRLMHPDWKYNINYNTQQHIQANTILIVDRTIDTVAPLLHEFTYQAMCVDVLQVDGEICKLPDNNHNKSDTVSDDVVVLSEDDTLWCELRHQHIGGVLHCISEKFNEFRRMNRVAGVSRDVKKVSVKELVRAMSDMPQYKQMIQRYHKHMIITEQLRKLFDGSKFEELAELEQSMCTGLDSENKPIDHKLIKRQVIKLSADHSIRMIDKVRLCIVYVLTCLPYPINDTTRSDILQILGKNTNTCLHTAVLNALNKLRPVQLDMFAKPTSKSTGDKQRVAELIKRNADSQFNLMRYSPMINSIMHELISGALSQDEYPTLSFNDTNTIIENHSQTTHNIKPLSGKSLRRKADAKLIEDKNDTADADQMNEQHVDQPSTIVFVLGGITCSEIRECYVVSDNTKSSIIIGSNTILKPKQYVQYLANASLAELEQALVADAAATANI